MTVNDLRKLIEGADGDLQVLIPINQEFDGAFYSPCIKESGITTMGLGDLSEEDIKEMKLLNKPIPEEKSLLLVPCGFSEEQDHSHEMN